ncbi:MAG: hypothetical protein ABIF88_02065 [archaeon]
MNWFIKILGLEESTTIILKYVFQSSKTLKENPLGYISEMDKVLERIRNKKGRLEFGDPDFIEFYQLRDRIIGDMPEDGDGFLDFLRKIYEDYGGWLDTERTDFRRELQEDLDNMEDRLHNIARAVKPYLD